MWIRWSEKMVLLLILLKDYALSLKNMIWFGIFWIDNNYKENRFKNDFIAILQLKR